MKKFILVITLLFFIFPFKCFSGGPICGGPIGTGGIDISVPGVINKFQLGHTTEVLNDNRIILTTDNPVLWFDCNGADRNITLPPEVSSANLVFTIINVSDGAGEDIVIRDDTPTTLKTIGPKQGERVSCDGTSWKMWFDGGGYYDGVNSQTGFGELNPEAKVEITPSGAQYPLIVNMSHGDYGFKFTRETSWLLFSLGGSGYDARLSCNDDLCLLPTGNLYTNSKTGIGTITPSTLLELQKESADAEETISVYHDTEATAPIITMRKADNNATTPALVDDNAILGRINFKGHDGTNWHVGAMIEARVDGTPSDGADMPTELVFATTADGAGSPTERIVIQPDGGVDIINRLSIGVMTFVFTTEGDITSPLTGSVVLLDGDNDSENDTIDLQNGTTSGQVLYLVAAVDIDVDDTCTINYGDTTCTNCPATVFDKVGENVHLIWTGSTWVVVSLQDAL